MARSSHFDHETIELGAAAPRATQVVSATASTWFAWLKRAYAVRRQRRALAGLCERMRNEIGVSDADVYRETSRPFLDIPADADPLHMRNFRR
jgi:uncharacterized protein YjiS (DUF1127 family)